MASSGRVERGQSPGMGVLCEEEDGGACRPTNVCRRAPPCLGSGDQRNEQRPLEGLRRQAGLRCCPALCVSSVLHVC